MPHLFDADEIAVIAITGRSDDDIKVILVVVKIRMFSSQIMLDATSAKVWTGKGVSDGTIARNDPDVLGSIDKDAIAREEAIAFLQAWREALEKGIELWNKIRRQVANLATNSRVGGCETGSGEKFTEIVNLFAFLKSVEKYCHRPKVERHRTEAH